MESASGEDIKIIAQTAAIWSGINSLRDRATSTLHSRAFLKRSNLTGRAILDKSPNRPASRARRLVIEATYTL